MVEIIDGYENICMTCGRDLSRSKQIWVIDPETLAVVGRSDSTCALSKNIMHLADGTKPIPTQEQINFSVGMDKQFSKLCDHQEDIRVRILLVKNRYDVANVEELLVTPETLKYLGYWASHGYLGKKPHDANATVKKLHQMEATIKEEA